MINITDKSFCSGCRACEAVCPTAAVKIEYDSEGFLYPKVEQSLCIGCSKCDRTCPVINKSKRAENELPTAYAAVNLNDEIRLESSSGGIFTLLAEEVINRGGVVFGAAFDEQLKVCHIAVENKSELTKLRGSKYTQSDLGDSLKAVKKFLEEGRAVLFTGTPCQIGGLMAFLGKDYDNLICQDIICHGVPSPKVWEKYIKFREEKAASKTRRTFFRHKKYGWKMFSVQFKFSNCTEYLQILSEDLYMRAFLRNVSLRPSCYNCAFKRADRESDITLADFWGIENIKPDFDDDKGTSLVMVHSEKGRALLAAVTDKMKIAEVDFQNAVQFNSAMVKSVQPSSERKAFFRDIDIKPFDMVVKKYCGDSLLVRVKNTVKKAIKKILF